MPSFKDVKISGLDPKNLNGSAATKGHNIVTVEVSQKRQVQDFEPNSLKDSKGIKYSNVLGGIKDAENVKNSRFKLNELTKGPLSVAAEEEARIEAEVLRRLTEQLALLSESGRKQGYQDGHQKGVQAGQQEFLAQAKPSLEKFDQLIQSFESLRQDIFKTNEEFLVRTIFQIAKAVILRELKEDSDYTKRLIATLIDRVGTRENIKIYVGEQEYSSSEALKQGLAQTLGQLKNISIERDPQITSYGCRIETEFGEVDAKLETQLKNIQQSLLSSNVES